MIELRWRGANNEDKHPTSDTPVFYDRAVHGKTRFLVLQYRVMENPLEFGLHEPIWSEWQDVPVEGE